MLDVGEGSPRVPVRLCLGDSSTMGKVGIVLVIAVNYFAAFDNTPRAIMHECMEWRVLCRSSNGGTSRLLIMVLPLRGGVWRHRDEMPPAGYVGGLHRLACTESGSVLQLRAAMW